MMKNEISARWMVVDNDVDALDTVVRLLAAVSDAEICSFPSAWQAGQCSGDSFFKNFGGNLI